MTRLVIDRETLRKLGPLDQALELCDESGHTLGFFEPLEDRELYRQIECPFSEEELAAAARQKGGRPLADILADLEKMP